MVPKFANPHSLSQDVETTTRAEIARQSALNYIVHDLDEEGQALKRDLDNLLRDTWVDALADIDRRSRDRKRRKMAECPGESDGQLVEFRLVSSMKQPQNISLDLKPPPPSVSRAPDCEDSETQAETRRTRALSVTVDIKNLREATVSARQVAPKAGIVEAKTPLAGMPPARAFPPLLVIEEIRAQKTARRKSRADKIPTASPHEPRPSCPALSVASVADQKRVPSKKRRKPDKEKPPPAYWRPSPNMRGRSVGYGLGYPCSWAPNHPYVRDTMTKGVESTVTRL